MPKPIAVRINWIRTTPTQTAAFAHGVAKKMTDNAATFPSPPVNPKALDDAANRTELAYANRMNGAAAKTEFEEAEQALDDMLHEQAAYVNTVALGDAGIIETAGFAATSNARKPRTIPAVPNAPAVKGTSAALHLQTQVVVGADSYCWVIFTDVAGTAAVTDTHISLSGAAIVIPDGNSREDLRGVFAAGTKIFVQVLAQNTLGKSGFSVPVSLTVGS